MGWRATFSIGGSNFEYLGIESGKDHCKGVELVCAVENVVDGGVGRIENSL